MSASLQHVLAGAMAVSPTTALCVAFSGGPDSTALLHALAQLPEARARRLRAIHVDHGLNTASGQWAERCNAFCASIDVPLTTVRVAVDDARGEGMEAAARRARYFAFAERLGEGEWLVLAHHRDDQVETVLLKLLRGAGPEGLGGMRALRPFAPGQLWRPLLETPREVLHKYLIENHLASINDPANTDLQHARNVVRHELLPAITRHWPHAGAGILHAAKLCRIASEFLDRETERALAEVCRADATLDADGWRTLPDALRAPVLDRWLREQGLPIPADAQRQELERQAANSSEDATPCIDWPGAEVRIWDGRLHAGRPLPDIPANWQATWDGTQIPLPAGCGTLVLETADSSQRVAERRLVHTLAVRLRRGGERIKPAGDTHTRELRDLFQQARIPPWLRKRCPLIFESTMLIAVADLWTSERGREVFGAMGVQPRWLRQA